MICKYSDGKYFDCKYFDGYDQYTKIIYMPEAPEYPYTVRIVTNGYCTGGGHKCRTVDEAGEWLNEHFPNIEVR